MTIQPPSIPDQCAVTDQVLQIMGGVHLLTTPGALDTGVDLMPLVVTLAFETPACLTLMLECSVDLASRLALAFFDVSASCDLTHTDLIDTVTELTNVIGGNLKALMPEDTVLGLPRMIAGAQPTSASYPQLSKAYMATTAGSLCLTFTPLVNS